MCERPKVYDETLRRARHWYDCAICDWKIAKGTTYYAIRGLWDDRWEAFHVHVECLGLYGILQDGRYDDCLAFQDVRELIGEAREPVANRWSELKKPAEERAAVARILVGERRARQARLKWAKERAAEWEARKAARGQAA